MYVIIIYYYKKPKYLKHKFLILYNGQKLIIQFKKN